MPPLAGGRGDRRERKTGLGHLAKNTANCKHQPAVPAAKPSCSTHKGPGVTHLGLIIDVPCEGDGVVGDLLNVTDGVEAFFVVSCTETKERNLWLHLGSYAK